MSLETRNRIVEAAARLFHEQGYAATGVATILREAGVNSGSLYHFFASKDELLKGVLHWYEENLYPLIMQPLEDAEADPIARIFCLMDWYRQFMLDNECRMGCPVGNLALEVSDTHPEVRPAIERNFDNWVAIIRGWLEQADGLPDALDRDAVARFVLTVMEGGVMQARAAGHLRPFEDSVAQLREYFETLTGWRLDRSSMFSGRLAVNGSST